MPANDIEVFEHLISNDETAVEIDFLTYAMFAHRKKQWMEHFKKCHNDTLPTPDQINDWISQLSEYDFGQMREQAAEFFDESAKVYLSEYVEEKQTEAVTSSVLAGVAESNAALLAEVKGIHSKVEEATSPWRHVSIALIMAIVAPFIIGGLIYFSGIFDKKVHDPISGSVTTLEESHQQMGGPQAPQLAPPKPPHSN
jgi:hypothetical protein